MGKVLQEDIKLAQKVQQKYGVPASVTLGQKIQETGWDESTVGKNNYFNIKGDGSGGYADYASKEDSFMAYGELLSKERYTSKTERANSPEEYLEGVKAAGYAEDPNYVSNVMAVIEDNNLTQYDTGTAGGSGSSIDLDWWGDIVIVVFSILLVLAGVVFIGLAVIDSNPVSEVVKEVRKKVK